MGLQEYLIETKQTYREFGGLINRSASVVCRLAKKRRVPTVETALLIERVTGGAVTVHDFIKVSDAA